MVELSKPVNDTVAPFRSFYPAADRRPYLPVEVNQCSVDGLNGLLGEAAMSRTTSENAASSLIVGLMFDGFGLEGDGNGSVAQSFWERSKFSGTL